MGELDSMEDESDEISDEFEFSHEIVGADGRRLAVSGGGGNGTSSRSEEDEVPLVGNSHVLPAEGEREAGRVADLVELNKLSRQELLRRYLDVMRAMKEDGGAPVEDPFRAYSVREVDEADREEPPEPPRAAPVMLHQGSGADEEAGDDEGAADVGSEVTADGGGGVLAGDQPGDDVYQLTDAGQFNQKDPNDRSREEVRSSWSSSEEALARCEGLIYNVPLNGGTRCTADTDRATLANITTEVTTTANLFPYSFDRVRAIRLFP